MLSEHEFIVAIRKLYPQVCELEKECLELFNEKYPPGRGGTGLRGVR